MEKRLFTSESVTEGHPDKLCDFVADSILDAVLKEDPDARVACEVCAITGFLLIMGEITTTAEVDYEKVAREAILSVGYDDEAKGFNGNTCEIKILLDKQSPDIAMGVNKSLEAKEAEDEDGHGAGDQGMMFGYAVNETPELMPYPISMAHKLTAELTRIRKSGELPYLRPDAKSQVTVEYDEDGKPFRIDAVVLSTQHDPDVSQEQIHQDIRKFLFDRVLPRDMTDENTRYYINPTGQFIVGGPAGDSGLTGRKIIVDTYGGYGRHGGGAFSGKDPSKVDRSATYAARYVAKNIVAAGLADKCEIQLSYAIGVARPVSIMVDTFGTGRLPDARITEIVRENFDLRPDAIIRLLELKRPIYAATSNYGHFGRETCGFTWEKTDKAEMLKKYL